MWRNIIYLLVSLTTFLLGVTTTAPWSARQSHVPHSYSSAEQELLSIERRYLDAHVQRDTATLDTILADDFVVLRRYGRVSDKAERLAMVENPDFSFISIDTDNVDVNVSGDEGTVSGMAVVRGRYGDNEFVSPPYRYTRRYEKREGRWQIVSVRFSRFR